MDGADASDVSSIIDFDGGMMKNKKKKNKLVRPRIPRMTRTGGAMGDRRTKRRRTRSQLKDQLKREVIEGV